MNGGYRSPAAKEAARDIQFNARWIERQREMKVREVKCPVCFVDPGETCFPVLLSWGVAHTGRYRLAASRGLVPLLPGE